MTGILWSIFPPFVGLFVLVEALAHTGVISTLATLLGRAILALLARLAIG